MVALFHKSRNLFNFFLAYTFNKRQRIVVERELIRKMKGHFYDSGKLISVKKVFCRGRKLLRAVN